MKTDNSSMELISRKVIARNVIEMACDYVKFSHEESCGRCIPGRLGSKRMLEILERIKDGEGDTVDIATLERLGDYMKITSLCPHGRLTGYAMLTMIAAFRDGFEHQIDSNQI